MATNYDELPIFPLPRLVLMPGALLPLHVFEQRYRELVAYCGAHNGLLGIATLKPGYEADYAGDPAIFSEIGVARLIRVHRLSNGSSNVVVAHVETARLVRELPRTELFRLVDAQGLGVKQGALAAPASELRRLLRQLGALSSVTRDELHALASLSDVDLVNDLAARLIRDSDERRRYVCLTSQADRADVLVGYLAIHLARTSPVADA